MAFSTANYDALLIGWSSLELLQPNVLLSVNSHYSSTSISARQKLIDDYNWSISDNGIE